MKKRILLFVIIFTLVLPTSAFAQTSQIDYISDDTKGGVELDFRNFSYIMNGVNEEDVVIEKTVEKPEAIEYQIYNKDETKTIDTVRVDFDMTNPLADGARAANTTSTYFSKYKTFKDGTKSVVELEYTVRVDLYSSGSFRAFYGADSSNLLIASAITSIELVNVKTGVKSSTGSYPTDSLSINYSCNLRTTGNVSTSIGANLMGAGFNVTTGSNVYYYKTVKETGTIKLYN